MKIFLATGNSRKLGEANAACKDFNIEVEQISLPIVEVQDKDPLKISESKGKEAFRLAGKSVVVTDTSWDIPALKGFPGGYMKDVSEWFESEDFIALLANKKDKRVSFTETIVYTDESGSKIFTQEYWGTIADNPRGEGNSIERIAEFNGNTIGEQRYKGLFSHDPKDYVWYRFCEWFTKEKQAL